MIAAPSKAHTVTVLAALLHVLRYCDMCWRRQRSSCAEGRFSQRDIFASIFTPRIGILERPTFLLPMTAVLFHVGICTAIVSSLPSAVSQPLFSLFSPAGTVQLATLHEWVQAIFPDVPPRLDEGVLDQIYYFRNSFTGATTTAEFRQNEVRKLRPVCSCCSLPA
jgi:hypothetical protein